MSEIYKGPIEEVKLVEKVKLTKEQAEAISKINNLDYAVDIHAAGRQPHHALRSLEASEFAKALYIGYEIEPEQPKFQPGDKVLFEYGDSVPRIYTLANRLRKLNGQPSKSRWYVEEEDGTLREETFRHASEEEIYWIGELGREKVGDFKEGDIVITDLNVPIKAGEYDVPGRLIGPERLMKFYKNKSLKGIYPAESFKPFPGDSK